ncbi:MAG: hypothetical protein GY851_07540 [bacterium]|nr:hypothetical protein [bacterium]
MTATVSAVLDEYGRDIVEVAKAVLELRATVEAVRELAKRNDCHCAWSKDGEPCTTCQFSSILEGGG